MFKLTHLFVPHFHSGHPLLCLLFSLSIGCPSVPQAERCSSHLIPSYVSAPLPLLKGLLPTTSNQSQKSHSHTPTKYPPNGKSNGQAGRTLNSSPSFPLTSYVTSRTSQRWNWKSFGFMSLVPSVLPAQNKWATNGQWVNEWINWSWTGIEGLSTEKKNLSNNSYLSSSTTIKGKDKNHESQSRKALGFEARSSWPHMSTNYWKPFPSVKPKICLRVTHWS